MIRTLNKLRTGLRCAAISSLALTLSSCFISPGTFQSELTLNEDGTFAFSYDGQVFFAALSDELSKDDEAFEPECLDDQFEERECSFAEVTEQRQEWEAGAERRAQKRARDARLAAGLLGGLDPNDPEAPRKFAAQLERQAGWDDVNYAGNGIFDVEYSIRGTLTHDFSFPTMEKMSVSNPFVQLTRRDDGAVRVNASAFAPSSGSNPMGAMMGGMGGMFGAMSGLEEADGETDKSGPPSIPLDGTFRIITNARILANNTDGGPAVLPGGEMLQWKVNSLTKATPTALIQTDMR